MFLQGNSKIMTNIRPNVKNMKRIKTNLKKPCLELNKREIKMDYFKPLQKGYRYSKIISVLNYYK